MAYEPIRRITYQRPQARKEAQPLQPLKTITLSNSRYDIYAHFCAVEVDSLGQRKYFFPLREISNPILSLRKPKGNKFNLFGQDIIIEDKYRRYFLHPNTLDHHGNDENGPLFFGSIISRIRRTTTGTLLDIGFIEKTPNSGVFTHKNSPEILLIMNKGKVVFLGKADHNPALTTAIPVEIGYAEKGDMRCRTLRMRSELAEFRLSQAGHPYPDPQTTIRVELEIDPLPSQTPENIPAQKFAVGGVNSELTIKSLSSINSISLIELERRMRPGQYSTAGFIDYDDSLLEVLAKDNAFVNALQLTHQNLAHPLLYAMRLVEMFGTYDLNIRNASGLPYVYRGQKYKVLVSRYMGSQESPFGDGLRSGTDYLIIRGEQRLFFSGLTALLIHSYGFYESESVSYYYNDGTKKTESNLYRVDPREIIDFFGLKDNQFIKR